jgi:uncharacterized protein YaiI (UPF0178 family)
VKILVDADACPVKGIIVSVARQYKLDVTMLIDTSHELNDGYSTVITVDKARDSVDIALINLVRAGDLVVTQDFGVAAMALGKKARAVNQNGLIYSDDNIDGLLFERHIGQKVRRAGGRTAGSRKRTREDDSRFERTFRNLAEQALQGT